jgi:hypothetical protein
MKRGRYTHVYDWKGDKHWRRTSLKRTTGQATFCLLCTLMV